MRYDISFLQVMLAAPINLNVCLPSNAYPKHGLVMVKMIAEIFLMNNIAKVRKIFFYRIRVVVPDLSLFEQVLYSPPTPGLWLLAAKIVAKIVLGGFLWV